MLLRLVAYILMAVLAGPALALAQSADGNANPPNALNLEELLPQSQDPPPPVYNITDVGPRPPAPTPTKPVSPPRAPTQPPTQEDKTDNAQQIEQAQQEEEERRELDNWIQGCWVAVRNDGSRFSKRVYCFDGNGAGTIIGVGLVSDCTGSFYYTINSGTVIMRNSKQSCGFIAILIQATVNCQRAGDVLRCQGVGTHNRSNDITWSSDLKRR